jgi:serine phosphatase RsbU (regulator of sigma subunit)
LDSNRGFTTHTLHLGSNDSIYLFSDGYADQFGGEKGKKFMVKKFHQNLLAIHHLAMQEQKQVLESQFNDWKASYEQVDDVKKNL